MFIKADRDFDLNYQGTFMVIKGFEQQVHQVVNIDGHELTLADVVTGNQCRLDIRDDDLCPELPKLGIRNIHGEAFLVGRRVARQYRRGTNFNNLEFVPVGHTKPCRVRNDDCTVSIDLFNPTYPDLRFAVWAIGCGKSNSQALSLDLAIVRCKKEIGIFYRQWRVGNLDPTTLTPHVYRGGELVESIVASYNWR